MDKTGLYVAIFMSLIFVLQTIMAMAGSFLDLDMDSGDGLDADSLGDGVEGSDGVFGVTKNDLFTLKGLLHFLFGFSWSWACFGISNSFTMILAVAVGIGCTFTLGWLYKKLAGLESENVNEDVKALVSRIGTIYSVFEEDGSVLVSIFYNGDYKEIHAYPEGDVTDGDQVYVARIDDGAVIVKKVGE